MEVALVGEVRTGFLVNLRNVSEKTVTAIAVTSSQATIRTQPDPSLIEQSRTKFPDFPTDSPSQINASITSAMASEKQFSLGSLTSYLSSTINGVHRASLEDWVSALR
jgi:hypothetical protein